VVDVVEEVAEEFGCLHEEVRDGDCTDDGIWRTD